jgi:hypothetical protein
VTSVGDTRCGAQNPQPAVAVSNRSCQGRRTAGRGDVGATRRPPGSAAARLGSSCAPGRSRAADLPACGRRTARPRPRLRLARSGDVTDAWAAIRPARVSARRVASRSGGEHQLCPPCPVGGGQQWSHAGRSDRSSQGLAVRRGANRASVAVGTAWGHLVATGGGLRRGTIVEDVHSRGRIQISCGLRSRTSWVTRTRHSSSSWHMWVCHLPLPFVVQDGAERPDRVPWDAPGLAAVFVGGSTGWKLGPEAARMVHRTRRRGLHAHMGRVSAARRIRYAQSIGCTSFDSSRYSRWRELLFGRRAQSREPAAAAAATPLSSKGGGTHVARVTACLCVVTSGRAHPSITPQRGPSPRGRQLDSSLRTE